MSSLLFSSADNHIMNCAHSLAFRAHRNHKRKYGGNPYLEHPYGVAAILAPYLHELSSPGVGSGVIWATALCHDVLEMAESEALREEYASFMQKINMQWYSGVLLLTDDDPSVGNRPLRKMQTRCRLSLAPGWVQTVKCADVLHNYPSIEKNEPVFAKVYRQEALELATSLSGAHPELRQRVLRI